MESELGTLTASTASIERIITLIFLRRKTIKTIMKRSNAITRMITMDTKTVGDEQWLLGANVGCEYMLSNVG